MQQAKQLCFMAGVTPAFTDAELRLSLAQKMIITRACYLGWKVSSKFGVERKGNAT
jgi:hypothetical protein